MGGVVLAGDQVPGTTVTLLEGDGAGGPVRRTVLPGGLRVITEQVSGMRSATVGIWVGVGSRDERGDQAGCSHYLEHVLFKGTASRTALEISAALDAVGGELNAFTAKEYTCYYARVLDSDLPLAVAVLSDLITSSLVTDDDVEAERGVILEEIAMRDDDPSDLVHDVASLAVFGDTPLGRSVLGTIDSIEAVPRSTVYGYYRRWYTPDRIVVSVAGGIAHDEVVGLVARAFGQAGVVGGQVRAQSPRLGESPVHHSGGVHVVERETEQANVVLAVPGLARTDERRFALSVLNAALGGGMSSRLFQEIREKRGLAYSVYSFTSAYADTGLVGVYAGCLPQKVDDVLELTRAELGRVRAAGIGAEELERAKGQLRGSLVLGLEDTGSRMTRIGKAELVYPDLLGVDELLARIGAVTLDDVAAVADDLFAGPASLAVVGPFDAARDFSASVA